MLVYLANYLSKYYSGFDFFSCLTFRAIISLLTAWFIVLWIGPNVIFNLKKISFKQIIRNEVLDLHFNKRNTPTMGGIVIIVAIVVSIFLWVDPFNLYVWCVLLVMLGYGIIGVFDDFIKMFKIGSTGLSAYWKYFWMSIIALSAVCMLYFSNQNTSVTEIFLPLFESGKIPQLGWLYILLAYFTIVGSGNAVNLTDGLDGLAIMPVIFVAIGFSIIAWATSNMHCANDLHIPYLYLAKELVIVCSIIVGAGLGFLWFNFYPAQIFMGDVGSLALGGALGIIAVLVRQEFLLAVMGGIFVIETLSVILQVCSFKLCGQRIFYMAPIHHHYELKGWKESHIIIRFWIISFILVLVGLVMISIRSTW